MVVAKQAKKAYLFADGEVEEVYRYWITGRADYSPVEDLWAPYNVVCKCYDITVNTFQLFPILCGRTVYFQGMDFLFPCDVMAYSSFAEVRGTLSSEIDLKATRYITFPDRLMGLPHTASFLKAIVAGEDAWGQLADYVMENGYEEVGLSLMKESA